MDEERQAGQGGQGGQGGSGVTAATEEARARGKPRGGPLPPSPPRQEERRPRPAAPAPEAGGNNNRDSRPSRIAPHVVSEAEKLFMAKTPIDPREWINLEKGSTDPSMRAMDLLCPIGKGTRGLIVAPPKAGKTTFLKQISNAVASSDPNIKQYVLLIDERPEEVTDFKRSVPAEVFASSSDQAYERHVAVAENLMRQAVEKASGGADVFILLDSLTRLARVHNQFATGARTMSGGLDSRAMEVPRRFFGAARKLEEGGSLTILATILVRPEAGWMRSSSRSSKAPAIWSLCFLGRRPRCGYSRPSRFVTRARARRRSFFPRICSRRLETAPASGGAYRHRGHEGF